MVRLLTENRGDTGTFYAPICAMLFALSLSGCAERHAEFLGAAPPPPDYSSAATSLPMETADTDNAASADMAVPEKVPLAGVNYLGAQFGGSAMQRQSSAAAGFSLALAPHFGLSEKGAGRDCRFLDRFDRKTTLAYNFDVNHQMAFKMGINNHGGGMEMSHALLTFNYHFNSVHSAMEAEPAEKCRYASHWQGVAGSAYNEVFLRDSNTMWAEARDRGLDFWH